jgi:DNA-binding NtrC family response regulator
MAHYMMRNVQMGPDYPTVLVAEIEEPVRCALRNEGYHVLVAHDWTEAFHLVKQHFRQIHLLLMSKSPSPDFARMLKRHRPDMRVLFIAQPNVLNPETVLAKVQELVKPGHSAEKIKAARNSA